MYYCVFFQLLSIYSMHDFTANLCIYIYLGSRYLESRVYPAPLVRHLEFHENKCSSHANWDPTFSHEMSSPAKYVWHFENDPTMKSTSRVLACKGVPHLACIIICNIFQLAEERNTLFGREVPFHHAIGILGYKLLFE